MTQAEHEAILNCLKQVRDTVTTLIVAVQSLEVADGR